MTREPRPLFDEIMDLAVYAPVGLLSKALEQVPGLVEEGRSRIGGQVDQARVIGRFAVGLARSKAVRSVVGAPARAARRPERTDRSERREPETPRRQSRPAPPSPEQPAAEAAAPAAPAPPQAIPDYDALSASQVVPRLQGLDRDELAAVGRYEAATRQRRTILNRVAQLERALDER